MKEIRTQIEIAAPASTVWQTLTSFKAYPEWNPFITEIQGDIQEGAKLSVLITPPGRKAMEFTPRVMRVIPMQEFRWLGRVFLPGIFDGEHIFEIEPIDNDRSRLVHREKFKGLLVPFILKSIGTATHKGFELMNKGIKKRAEATYNQGNVSNLDSGA